jgi:hypothetical protein
MRRSNPSKGEHMKEALKLALEAAYLAGFSASGEGYNGEYPFEHKGKNCTDDPIWCKDRDNELAAIKQALALDKKAENARALGLDYEPVGWWDSKIGFFEEKHFDQLQPLYTTPPAAQPAVPDAFGTREGEHPQYIQGWNDCRAETLKMRKA